jgi:hypothetical protein
MDILEQIQPKERIAAQKIQSIKKEIVKIEQPVEQITSFTNLDSMTKVETKLVQEITQPSQVSQVSQVPSTIYSIASYCNSSIKFQKQLSNLDESYRNKFSSELEYIINNANTLYDKQILDYLSRTYDKINFQLDVTVELDFDRQILNIEDSLYFKDDAIIIPKRYQYIISDLIQMLDINKKVMVVQGTRIVPLEINPMRRIKKSQIIIDQKNLHWCTQCEFYSICDQKNSNIL